MHARSSTQGGADSQATAHTISLVLFCSVLIFFLFFQVRFARNMLAIAVRDKREKARVIEELQQSYDALRELHEDMSHRLKRAEEIMAALHERYAKTRCSCEMLIGIARRPGIRPAPSRLPHPPRAPSCSLLWFGRHKDERHARSTLVIACTLSSRTRRKTITETSMPSSPRATSCPCRARSRDNSLPRYEEKNRKKEKEETRVQANLLF
jgi:hypothetical protein